MKNKDMNMSLPTKAKVVIIGGGIHGLSTAWKLSETYKNPGDIIVLEKKDTAAGASGIACGVVRNNYFQPAMRELMAHSVSVWESDPKAFKYNPVGYLQISPEVMHEDVASIYEQQKAIGYESVFIEGEKENSTIGVKSIRAFCERSGAISSGRDGPIRRRHAGVAGQ